MGNRTASFVLLASLIAACAACSAPKPATGHTAASAAQAPAAGAATAPAVGYCPPGDPGHTVNVTPVEPGLRSVLNGHLTGASR
jgi:hypothetical protein